MKTIFSLPSTVARICSLSLDLHKLKQLEKTDRSINGNGTRRIPIDGNGAHPKAKHPRLKAFVIGLLLLVGLRHLNTVPHREFYWNGMTITTEENLFGSIYTRGQLHSKHFEDLLPRGYQ
jgi:hypothetical protein